MIRLRRATGTPGLSRLAELSPLLRLLDCRPGDRLLDLGGPLRISSRLLTRLGFVAAVAAASDRRGARSRQRGTGDAAEMLPYLNEAFDGVIGVGALPRVVDSSQLLAEVCRVLKPGARAVLSEGRHAGSGDDSVGDWHRGVDIAHTAHRLGLRTLERHEVDELLIDQPSIPAAASPLVVLVRNGERPLTSRRPGVLHGRITAESPPAQVRPKQTVVVRATVENTGDTVWLQEPSRYGGFVTIVCRLATRSGVVVNGCLRRTRLPAEVLPGASARTLVRFRVPSALAPGGYTLVLELYNEMVGAFSDVDPESAGRLALEVLAG